MADKKENLIRTPAALKIAKDMGYDATLPTLIRWCREHGIGKQVGSRGKWYVNKEKFVTFLEGRRDQS